ncbi:flagellin [Thioclava sp. 15-R06ZXC-3]|uniref:Flagellin n=1 Tax=Thioclava arctica TaxID=3238301 RepID=A0ABV3TPY7_9RHOB
MSGAIGSILSNSGALTALNGISAAQQSNDSYEQQLSSGQKLNSPADNPAGFITAQGFTSQINGVSQASSNANEGISLLQTAQGAVQQQLNVAQKLNSIAVQAANGTQTPEEAQSLQGVVSQLTGQVSTIANQTQFNNISLLDGSFSGVQFQVGANEGQTLSLSIGSTSADKIGMNTLDASATMYNSGSSAAVTANGAAFTAGSLTIQGGNGHADVAVAVDESAASIADSINQHTNQTGVTAQARTELDLTASGTAFNFTLGNGGSGSHATNTVNISATSKSGLVDAINGHTSTTGITAKQDTAGNLVLTQGDGKNISITNVTSGVLKNGSVTGSASGTDLVAQGKVSFQSDAAFNVKNAGNIGLQAQSNLKSLSAIDVSTTKGANEAINVVKYAIQGLNNLGGQLGATQQRMQATLNNLTTTQSNLQNGLSTVQDANIPEVTQKLTQSQIQAQAGVSALKSSSRLQQSYLSLLP